LGKRPVPDKILRAIAQERNQNSAEWSSKCALELPVECVCLCDGFGHTSGALILPDLQDGSGKAWHLAVGAGKDANIYAVNRDSMGKFSPNNHNAIYQEIDYVLGSGVWAVPAYFQNTVHYGGVSD
jgi:hypothetical protein